MENKKKNSAHFLKKKVLEQSITIKSNSNLLNSLLWRKAVVWGEFHNLTVDSRNYFLFHLIFSSFIAN